MLYVFPIHFQLITYHRLYRYRNHSWYMFLWFSILKTRIYVTYFIDLFPAYNLFYANYLGPIIIIWVLFFHFWTLWTSYLMSFFLILFNLLFQIFEGLYGTSVPITAGPRSAVVRILHRPSVPSLMVQILFMQPIQSLS